MNKALAIIILMILCSSIFLIVPPRAMGWWAGPVLANHHGEMTRDALLGLVDKGLLTYEDIGDIPEYANAVDIDLPHPDTSCHRVRKYQNIFQFYGGKPCIHSGAEWHAAEHIQMAYEYYSIGNIAEAQRHLGYAIHYIQDAACPPHVFPFREAWNRTNPPRPDIPAHVEFEGYASVNYRLRNWPQLVRNAPIWYIAGPDDLRKKVIWLADMVWELDCSYVRQDETIIGDLPPEMDWYMSDNDIGFCMAMAASLVKGAVLYAMHRPYNGRSGGPDAFGYVFTDSFAPGGPTYNWIEISETGTEILPDSDDEWVANISIGFFFNYYGTDYSQVAIGNNGLLFSGVGTWQYINDPITESPSIHGFIAPYWDDIVTWGSAGAIYYQTIGDAPNRKFVVEWCNNQHYHHSDRGITFEVILFEGTNDILFQYKDVTFGTVYGAVGGDNPPYDFGGSATVGIEDPTGTIGLQYSFNEPVIMPGLAILFKFPAFAGTNMHISMNAPASMDRGGTMTYTIFYNNFGNQEASHVMLQATLSSYVNFISASDGGEYDPVTRTVTWNIGTVPAFPSGRGSRTITVTIPSDVPIGTIIQTTASVSTSTLETRYDDNTASAQTIVTGTSLPPNVNVGPIVGTVGGVPSVYWRTPITFTYYEPTAVGVDIIIHLDDGGPDITGSMTGGPPTWTFTVTFYPRTGHATVTYIVHYPTGDSQINFNIYVDPAGYVYDVTTGQRIAGATVWLQRPDGQGGWENVPTGQIPPIMQPDINPQITGPDGQFQWDVLEGTYRVHVEAPGYYPADSVVVVVPPPVTDLHIGLTPIPPPPEDIPPTTTLEIGEPKYADATGNIYVSSATPFTLSAEDNPGGTGVASTLHRIYNSTYNSGWIEYSGPFYLIGLSDGKYSIDYYSIDNAGNVEPTNTATVILFSWQYIYEDTQRGTTLKININHKFFQFITMDEDYGIRQASRMYESYVTLYYNGEYISLPAIIIRHRDSELLINAYAGTSVPFCYAIARDLQTGKRYRIIIDPPEGVAA